MPDSSGHHGLNPRGSYDPAKGRHPDLDEQNNLKWTAYLRPEAQEFTELRNDPVRWAAFMDGVAQRQSREHPEVQRYVSGVEYAGPDPLLAFQRYEADLASARSLAGLDNEFTADQVRDMTLEEYDERFDEHGRPRPGYSYRTTDRDLNTQSHAGMDGYSQLENVSNRW